MILYRINGLNFFAACLFLLCMFASASAQNLAVPYVQTPQHIVDGMLDLANVGPGDYVIDLGSGDGRFVISAARRGATGHGVEIDPERIKESNENAAEAGVSGRVMFLEEDIYETDYSMASVVTMYLFTSINLSLKPGLLANLEPGTRVVSHMFGMGDWEPDITKKQNRHVYYYWVIPASAEGEWEWKTDGEHFTMKVNQKFQKVVDIHVESEFTNSQMIVDEAIIHSDRFSLIVRSHNNSRYVYNGRIDGDVISGSVQIHNGEDFRLESWTAGRN